MNLNARLIIAIIIIGITIDWIWEGIKNIFRDK